MAFREQGIEAYSCDLLPCSGGHPEWHIQDDILDVTNDHWDMVISFPPCTDLTVSGARWFGEKRINGTQERSIKFFLDVWCVSDVVENPIGIMSGWSYIKTWFPDIIDIMIDMGFPKNPNQVIHPWQFGHRSSKTTCLWLNDKIPPLIPTQIVGPPKKYSDMSPVELAKWTEIHRCPPGPERHVIRSKTYSGIAQAMAEQWSPLIK